MVHTKDYHLILEHGVTCDIFEVLTSEESAATCLASGETARSAIRTDFVRNPTLLPALEECWQ